MTSFSAQLNLLRMGDWGVLLLGALSIMLLTAHNWMAAPGEQVLIKQGGRVVLDTQLSHDQLVTVNGPLGQTRIQIAQHRVRVVSDPGPRQICVQQGWVSRAGQAAICLPNQVSVEIIGRKQLYDSLNY